MKRGILLPILAAIVVAMPSCKKLVGEGPVVVENRSNAPFMGVALEIESDTYFSQSLDYKVEIHAQQNVLNEIETVLVNNKLVIRWRHRNTNLKTSERVKIFITAPDVNLLQVSGSGNLQVTSALTTPIMQFHISGSGNINAAGVTASNLSASVSGSGKITVNNGSADLGDIDISGSGYIDLQQVTMKNVDAHISGSGSTKVHAEETLKASISGSGHVFYIGAPVINSSVSGSGSVVKL